MRVIAGKARRTNLKTVSGMDTRPTTDRIKETLFNILQPQLSEADFLDLFSGSGAIAIEALSRGAGEAVLIEQQKAALDCIHENLNATHMEEQARVLPVDIYRGIDMLRGHSPFSIIFMDPPYHEQFERPVLEALAESGLVDLETIVIVEALIDTNFDFVEHIGFSIERIKKYKTNQHVFLQYNRG